MYKKIIKSIIPNFIISFIKNIRDKIEFQKFKKLSLKETFETIYNDKLWTPEDEKKNFTFYSGLGSHKSEFISEYLIKTKNFLKSFDRAPDILELGCGDFKVSSNLVKFSNSFIACDIFEDLIELNKKKFVDKKLKFMVLDITNDELPKADVCIVRCVLQHLSNKMINNFLQQIEGKFKYLLVTEHYPNEINFLANHDIVSGPNIRLKFKSAVDLTKAPFNLQFKHEQNICKVYSKSIEGFLNTQLYQL